VVVQFGMRRYGQDDEDGDEQHHADQENR